MRRRSIAHYLPLGLLCLAAACGAGHVAPKASVDPKGVSPPASDRPASVELRVAESFAIATSMAVRRNRLLNGERRMLVAPNGVAYIDKNGARVLATPTSIKRVAEPQNQSDLCVSKDGKLTFFVTRSFDTNSEHSDSDAWFGTSFEGPMQRIGDYPARIEREHDYDRRPAWSVYNQKTDTTSIVDCETGTFEQVAGPATEVSVLYWSERAQLISLRPSDPNHADHPYGIPHRELEPCRLRATPRAPWKDIGECGTIARSAQFHEVRTRSGCAFALKDGQAYDCATYMASRTLHPTPEDDLAMAAYQEASEASVSRARFYSDSEVVVPGSERGLFAVNATGDADPTRLLGPLDLVGCIPLLATQALYLCGKGTDEVVVKVLPDGRLTEELRLPEAWWGQSEREMSERELLAPFSVTADGGVAVPGWCPGTTGDAADVVCARSPDGTWRNAPFSNELSAELRNQSPFVNVIPSPTGPPSVTLTPRLASVTLDTRVTQVWQTQEKSGQALLLPEKFRRDANRAVRVLADLESSGTPLATALGWSGERSFWLWPTARFSSLTDIDGYCRLDSRSKDRKSNLCVPGRLANVGSFGLWEKAPGVLYETVDAGRTWAPVALPAGTETDDVTCYAIGCRIGPYWRLGWGQSAK